MKGYLSFLVRRKALVFFIFLVVIVAGVFVYRELPMDAIPDVAPPMVQVFTEVPGLSAQEVEKFVTYPLETALMGLPDVEKVRSVSNFGLSLINIYFKDGTDIYRARQLVGERLQEVREEIPFGEPGMGPISTATGLILFYYLDDSTGKFSLQELRTIQDWIIKPVLMSTPGVNEVLSIGGFVKQYQISLDPYRMYNYGVSLSDVIEALETNNSSVGGQFIVENSQEIVVRGVGMVEDIDDLRKIVVKSRNGFPVFLEQVANISMGGEIRRGLQTMNGQKEVVAGMVIKLFGTNASQVISRVEKKIEEINSILPSGVRIVPYYEQKSLVDAVLKTVLTALLIGILLVVLVLFLFLRHPGGSLVVVLSLPFSLLVAIILMKYFGVSLNLMSVGGLAIALGILVDATIVIVENIYRHFAGSGNSSVEKVVVNASSEVMVPVTIAMIITVLSFVPLLSLEGVEGRMFKPLLYAVLFALMGSIIYAFFISPTFSAALIRNVRNVRALSISRWYAKYVRFLAYILKRRFMAPVLYAILIIFALFALSRTGSEFVPSLKEGTLVIRTSLHPAVSLEEAKRNAFLIEKRIMSVDGVRYVTSRIGRGEVGAHTDPINSIESYVILEPDANQEDVERGIREALEGFPGAFFNFTQPIKMTTDELLEGARGDVVIKVFGSDIDTLQAIADRITSIIGVIDGVEDVRSERLTGTPQLVIKADRYAAARYGLDVDDVNRLVEYGIGGGVVGSVYEGVRKIGIFVRFKDRYRNSVDKIKNLPVYGHGREIVPLSEIAHVKRIRGPRQITREDFHRFSTVSFNVRGRDVGSVVMDVESVLDTSLSLPPGYIMDIGGQYELQRKSFRRFSIIVPIVISIIAFLLFATLGSLSMTLVILLVIPAALTGGIISLYLSGEPLSVPSSIGFIALLGIATEVAVVLMSYWKEMERKFDSPEKIALRTIILRTRAVSMTIATTALGLFPLVFSRGTGSEVQRPLAIVVLGGLITLIVVSLYILPSIYASIEVAFRQKKI